MDVTIRPARDADAAGLARVQVDSYRQAYHGLLPDAYLNGFSYIEQEQDWRALLAEPEGQVLLVGEVAGGELVGYVLGRPDAESRLPKEGELLALHVRCTWQGHGVGRKLVTALASELKKADCDSLMLRVLAGNRPARGFYEHLGGTSIPERRISIDGMVGEVVEAGYRWRSIDALAATVR